MGKENPDLDKIDAKFIAGYAGLVVAGSVLGIGRYAVRKARQKLPFLPTPKEKPNDTYIRLTEGRVEHFRREAKKQPQPFLLNCVI